MSETTALDARPDEDRWWRAVQGQDPRFDGAFVMGVLPTDFSCRPSCPARTLGLGEGRALVERSRRWAPYRAYAVQHLWAVGDHAVDRLPTEDTP